MFVTKTFFAVAAIFHTVHSRVPGWKRQAGEMVLPTTKTNFQKDGVTAAWAPGNPKGWGTEDARYDLNITDRGPDSFSAVTPDEKYLALWNGGQVQFTDLDSKTTVATFKMELPKTYWSQEDLRVHSAPQGGYDILVLLTVYTLRQRVTADLQPVGPMLTYEGAFADITVDGKLLTNLGNLYDLENTANNHTVRVLSTNMTNPFVSTYRTAPDAKLLGFLDWDLTAKLVSAADGADIATLGGVDYDGNGLDFSPDGKYVAVLVDTKRSSTSTPPPSLDRVKLRIFNLVSPTSAPNEFASFDAPGGSVKWSPSNKHIAASDAGRLQIFDYPSGQVVQTWAIDSGEVPKAIVWHDGGSKISWSAYFGIYLYDFETNLLYLWAPTVNDRSWKANSFIYLKERGLYGTEGGDNSVRFWKI